MHWMDFMNAMKLQDRLDLYLNHHECSNKIFGLLKARSEFQAETHRDLVSVLYRHRASLATDTRDKIYGVGALATDRVAQAVISNVDYTINTNVLFPRAFCCQRRPGARKMSCAKASSLQSGE
jgi:hypothetical protein